MNCLNEYNRWINMLENNTDLLEELKGLSASQIEDSFYRDLEFGTGGLRGVIGAGINRINIYTVAKATEGLANYLLNKYGDNASVIVGYDTRIKSD